MASKVSNPLAKKSLEKTVVQEVQKKLQMSELVSGQTLENNEQGVKRTERVQETRNGLEHVMVARRPEQLTSDIVLRMYQSGLTPEQWRDSDLGQREQMLKQAGQIMSQEMVLPPEVRGSLSVRTGEAAEGGKGPEGEFYVDRALLEDPDCTAAYGKLYYDMSVLDCRNTVNSSALHAYPGALSRPVISEGAYAESQKNLLTREFQKQGGSGLKTQIWDEIEKPFRKDPDNLGDWKRIKKELSVEDNLKACNPNHEQGEVWQRNCQRCVPTYELRSRGYDVTALPRPLRKDKLAIEPFDAWENPEILTCSENCLQEIRDQMKQWGDGARAQITAVWKWGGGGHTFVAEQRDGVTHFLDPQTGESDVEYYFEHIVPEELRFARIDQLQPSKLVLKCCKEVNG